MLKSRTMLALEIISILSKYDSIVTVAMIAKQTNRSTSLIEPIMSALSKGGMVVGFRGPGGGYKLAPMVKQRTLRVLHRTMYPSDKVPASMIGRMRIWQVIP